MAAPKTTQKTKKKSSAPAKARAGVVSVSGDMSVRAIVVAKPRKNKKNARLPEPRKPDAPPVLVAVDLDAGPAKVSRYAGLFFMFVGVCFAAYSLSGMYVELVEMTTSTHRAYAPRHIAAQIITSTALLQQNQLLSPTSPISAPVVPPEEIEEEAIQPTSSSSGSDDVHAASTASSTSGTSDSQMPTQTLTTAPIQQPTTQPKPIDDSIMRPNVDMVVRGGMPHEGIEEVAIRVLHAHTVELLLVPRETLMERYLGKARRVSNEAWAFALDTRHVPNGEYRLFARISNDYGSYHSEPIPVRIKNSFSTPTTLSGSDLKESSSTSQTRNEHTTEDHTMMTEIANAAIEFKSAEPKKDMGEAVVPLITKQQPVVPPTVPDDTATASLTTAPAPSIPSHIEERAMDFVHRIDVDLENILELYGVALRGRDVGAIQSIEDQFAQFEREVAERIDRELVGEGMVSTTDEAALVRERIISLMRDERERRAREERIIMERVGDKIQRDSDRDGISDYDEKTLYKTDPYIADSDSDGFTDGAEVLSGFDPANDARETMVAFEDPRMTGTERSDLLEIARLDVIATDAASSTNAESESRGVLLAGKALPNSFITLYIYSTPVVVTVKTNDDGSWSYLFDKELEDGQHEVYVGVTDNAGKLVAKSKPFAFVKTANAYAVGRVSETPVAVATPSPRLMSENAIILTTSLVVIMVGLVLVLIGAYLARREKPHILVAPSAV